MLDGANLERPEVIAATLKDIRQFGDDVGIWLNPSSETRLADVNNGGEEPFLWLQSEAEKRRLLESMHSSFISAFGFEPSCAGAYHLDQTSMAMLTEIMPQTKTVIAGCFEEGVRVFHGCNHSWYLFNEGMPWNPWYPSKTHALKPASSEDDWTGLVAVPHLIRDLVLSYEGRNDFFASHPQNVQRAMANDGASHPYDYNLLEQHRLQEDFNHGYSWVHVFVGPNWLSNNHNIEDSDEITQGIYLDYLEHFAAMKTRGELTDMTMPEFGVWFKANRQIGQPQVALAKDVLYGSGKQYVWYADSSLRATLDATQGGSLGDLRPYAASYSAFTGADSPRLAMGSYPYLIQSQHRTGYPNHFRDGSRTTCVISVNDSSLDLALCPTKVVSLEQNEEGVRVRLAAVNLPLEGITASLMTTVIFRGGRIETRRVIHSDQLDTVFKLREVVKGCYGFTEYPEDLRGIRLNLDGQSLEYAYRSRHLHATDAKIALATVPQIGAKLELLALTSAVRGEVIEGFVFNPFYTLALEFAVLPNEEVRSCLKVSAS